MRRIVGDIPFVITCGLVLEIDVELERAFDAGWLCARININSRLPAVEYLCKWTGRAIPVRPKAGLAPETAELVFERA